MNIRRIVLCGIGACPPLCSAVFAQLNLPPAPAGVQVTQQYGWEFVTVNVSGNAPYVPANPETNTIARNRGQVSEPFRISRTEVTTGQWVEFLNVVGSIGPMPAQLQSVLGGSPYIGAINWGASREGPLGPGASFQVWDVPGADRYYVGGISWYMTALYCNWITNNRQASWQALSTGAYDTSTWGIDQNTGGYTDAPTHLPGARVWIPTLDQWLAATFYDPNRYGAGQPGWWEWVHGSDSPAVPGPPGVGTTPSGWAGGGMTHGGCPWGLTACSPRGGSSTPPVARRNGPRKSSARDRVVTAATRWARGQRVTSIPTGLQSSLGMVPVQLSVTRYLVFGSRRAYPRPHTRSLGDV